MPGRPPATSTMWVALSASGVTRCRTDQVLPWSAEYDSQPMSRPAVCVSQVAYKLPAASMPIAPSIHHSASDMVSVAGPIRTGADHVLPLLGDLEVPGRRAVVTPGMIELGSRQRLENEEFARAVGNVADTLVIVGST